MSILLSILEPLRLAKILADCQIIHLIVKFQSIHQNCCKIQEYLIYLKSISNINIMFKHFFLEISNSCSKQFHNFFFKNALKFLLSVTTYVSISIKTTSSHKGNLRVERNENSDTQFFCMLYWDFWFMLAPQWWRNLHLVIKGSINFYSLIKEH